MSACDTVGQGARGRALGSTGQRCAPRRGMAAGNRFASVWQMGFGAAAEGESPRASCEAEGTRALSVIGGGDDVILPGPPKQRGGG